MASVTMEKLKLLVVIGTTGVGKSKLGVDIARALRSSSGTAASASASTSSSRCSERAFKGAEIINADAVQMYKGLDIATAKLTTKEMDGVVHHMLGVNEHHDAKSVLDFRNEAKELVRDINARGKLPILLGGTLYYIQSLLWPSLRDEGAGGEVAKVSAISPERRAAVKRKLDAMDLHSMYEELRSCDPESARRLHPNNTRKVRTSLEIFHETGTKHSDIIKAQHAAGALTDLQYNCRVIWLKCESGKLETRLRNRVDEMVASGLVEEAEAFVAAHPAVRDGEGDGDGSSLRGIFQSIGYKEFMPYMKLDEASRKSPVGEQILGDCVEFLKLHHIKYSKSQLKWIRNRVITRNAPVFSLDTSDADVVPGSWETRVRQPAIRLVDSWGEDIDEHATHENVVGEFNVAFSENDKDMGVTRCDVCDRYIMGSQWEQHIKSRKHRRRLAGQRKKKRRLEALGTPEN